MYAEIKGISGGGGGGGGGGGALIEECYGCTIDFIVLDNNGCIYHSMEFHVDNMQA